jgi:hypothetical protein
MPIHPYSSVASARLRSRSPAARPLASARCLPMCSVTAAATAAASEATKSSRQLLEVPPLLGTMPCCVDV